MRFQPVIYIFLLLTTTSLGDTGLNKQLKEKLKIEVKALQSEINSAAKDISQLRKDKAALTSTLRDMEEWGNTQEQAKLQYYEEIGKLEEQIHKTTTALSDEKKRNESTLFKYRKLKQLMCYLAGGLLAVLYTSIGARIATIVAPALGPWGFLLQYLGPVAAFGVGYFLAFSIF